jgi:hypothetical protein
MNQDPVKAPLQVVAVGLLLTIVTIVCGAVMFFLLERGSPISGFPNVLSVLSVGSDATVLVGCVMLWKRKRPGAAQAMVSAFCHGGDLVFIGLWLLLGAFSPSSAVYTAMGLVNGLVDVVAVALLALSLRELSLSRGRNFDTWLIGAAVLMGISVLSRLFDIVVSFSIVVYLVTSAITIAVRVVLVVVAFTLSESTTLAEPQLAYDSAYRGPTGAVTTPTEGSLALGFLAGFLGGCIGAGLVLALAKGPKTKRGAGLGFACQTVVGIALRAAMS